MLTAPLIPLNDGRSIPQLGLGTWPLDDDGAERAVLDALEIGYRHVDSARRYGNERGVGRGVIASGLPREDVWVTTKLDGEFQGEDRAVAGLEGSLELMGLDYVDLLLIHWPLPARGEYASTFRTFAGLRERGLARSIGVSNFTAEHLRALEQETGLVPAVNQIQIDPTIPREAQRAYAAEHGIVTQSWSPIGQGGDLLQHPAISAIAEEHGRTPAQIVLRWHVQQGLVPLPKSQNPERMRANLDVFDFVLDDAQLARLGELSQGPDAGVDSDVDGH
ncbi:aldo/keto reductase [Arenivirga flava]|uniref:Oxidoreductase n=1 Tax=Arenivirga flava TaxID=1930060 RepID=A0AA37XBI7_9MICO|nr:aldo/keto reductase [Arenivirga flava]GMA27452.1 oxidoreductase [Arenivirga flava]